MRSPSGADDDKGRIPDGSTVHVGAGDGGLVIGDVVMAQAAWCSDPDGQFTNSFVAGL